MQRKNSYLNGVGVINLHKVNNISSNLMENYRLLYKYGISLESPTQFAYIG